MALSVGTMSKDVSYKLIAHIRECVKSVSENVCTLQLAGERCGKSFAKAEGKKENELKLMLNWASEGFLPTGPEGFAPPGMCTFINIYLFTHD